MNPAELLEWTRHFAEHRFRSRGMPFEIKELTAPLALKVTTSSKKETYAVAPRLEGWKIPENSDGQFFVIAEHCQANVDALVKHWLAYVAHEKLVLVFVNPHSAKEKYWIIHPFLHHSIADPATLKMGLSSMATMVDFVI